MNASFAEPASLALEQLRNLWPGPDSKRQSTIPPGLTISPKAVPAASGVRAAQQQRL
ncbi:MAG: hypothetical protein LBK52_06105 [Deltaproteobacteria bacterium]|nr:hypothetical protein [Deltaproteobacteria bacterium]